MDKFELQYRVGQDAVYEYYWLTKCTNNENHNINGYSYVSHNHLFISSSTMTDATLFYCFYVGMVV